MATTTVSEVEEILDRARSTAPQNVLQRHAVDQLLLLGRIIELLEKQEKHE
jgi:hypothetical protein